MAASRYVRLPCARNVTVADQIGSVAANLRLPCTEACVRGGPASFGRTCVCPAHSVTEAGRPCSKAAGAASALHALQSTACGPRSHRIFRRYEGVFLLAPPRTPLCCRCSSSSSRDRRRRRTPSRKRGRGRSRADAEAPLPPLSAEKQQLLERKLRACQQEMAARGIPVPSLEGDGDGDAKPAEEKEPLQRCRTQACRPCASCPASCEDCCVAAPATWCRRQAAAQGRATARGGPAEAASQRATA